MKHGSPNGFIKLSLSIGNKQVLNRSWELMKSLYGLFLDILMLGLLDVKFGKESVMLFLAVSQKLLMETL